MLLHGVKSAVRDKLMLFMTFLVFFLLFKKVLQAIIMLYNHPNTVVA